MFEIIDEILDSFISVFNKIFDFLSGVLSSLFSVIFKGCEDRGAAFLGAIDNLFTFDNFEFYIVYFVGACVSLFLFKVTIRLLRG